MTIWPHISSSLTPPGIRHSVRASSRHVGANDSLFHLPVEEAFAGVAGPKGAVTVEAVTRGSSRKTDSTKEFAVVDGGILAKSNLIADSNGLALCQDDIAETAA